MISIRKVRSSIPTTATNIAKINIYQYDDQSREGRSTANSLNLISNHCLTKHHAMKAYWGKWSYNSTHSQPRY